MRSDNPTKDQRLDFDEKALMADYNMVLDTLERKYTMFSPIFMNLGLPFFTNNYNLVQTSQVQIDPILDTIRYAWNANHYQKLKLYQKQFTILHETLHILLGHLKGMKYIDDREKYNYACDAVINDIIDRQFSIKVPNNLITGEFLINENCADKSAEYVYSKIVSYDKNSVRDYDDILNGTPMDEHVNWNEKDGERIEKSIPFEYDNAKQIIKSRGDNPGNQDVQVTIRQSKFSLQHLIRNIIGRKLDETLIENWRRPNYKLYSVYPEVILPFMTNNTGKNLLSLLFCIDTSGSVPTELVEEFIGIAQNHLLDYDVKAVSFDTEVYPFDIKNVKRVWGRGGTKFQTLSEWVYGKTKEDFDVIFVLTDGWGGKIVYDKLERNRWFWIIPPYGNEVPEEMGVSYRIPHQYLHSLKDKVY